MIKIYSIVVTLLLGMASAATAERLTLNPEAKVLFEQGMRDYQAGRYDAALRSFEQAHQLAPRPELLFAMAQAARLGHRCEQASRYYDQFLATKPSERQVDAARQLRGQCKPGPAKVVAEEPARSSKVFTPDFDSSAQVSAPEAAPSQPSPAPIVAAKSSQRDDSSAWYSDTIGNVLLGSSLVTAAVGTYLLIDGSKVEASTYGDYEDGLDQSRGRRLAGYITLGAAGGLAALAIVRYVTAGNDDDDGVQLTGGFGPGLSPTVGLAGRF